MKLNWLIEPPGSSQLKKAVFFWQRLTHQVRSVFQLMPTALLSLSPPSTFCLWVALCVTDRPPIKACWPPSLPLPTVIYAGSVIQALIIPAGQELPLPCSLDYRVWQRTAVEGQRENFRAALIHTSLSVPLCLSLKITNKGKSFNYSSVLEGRLKKKVGWPHWGSYPPHEPSPVCLEEGGPTEVSEMR